MNEWPITSHTNFWIKFLIHVKISCQHYHDVIMGAIASQITSLTIVYSTVYSGTDQRKHQSSASLAFVLGIHRWPVNSSHKWPVTRKMFPFDNVIMSKWSPRSSWNHSTCLELGVPGPEGDHHCYDRYSLTKINWDLVGIWISNWSNIHGEHGLSFLFFSFFFFFLGGGGGQIGVFFFYLLDFLRSITWIVNFICKIIIIK